MGYQSRISPVKKYIADLVKNFAGWYKDISIQLPRDEQKELKDAIKKAMK